MSLRFLGIILRVPPKGMEYGFFYYVFFLSLLQYTVIELCRNFKRLREFEEIKISRGKAVEVTVNIQYSMEENSQRTLKISRRIPSARTNIDSFFAKGTLRTHTFFPCFSTPILQIFAVCFKRFCIYVDSGPVAFWSTILQANSESWKTIILK